MVIKMKRIVKRMVSLLLAAAFCLATGNLALAAEELKTAELRTKTIAELMDCIPQARTQAEADAVFEELMERQRAGEAVNGMIDSYVQVVSSSINSSKATVTYRVVAILPSLALLSVGYEYPAIVQTSGSFVSVERTTGTYTKTFNGPFLRCQLRTKFRFVARDYTENKVIRTYTNVGSGSSGRVVTAGDAAVGRIAASVGGCVITLLFPGLGSFATLGMSVALGLSLPSISEGQYIRISTSVSGNRLTTTVRIWASYETYTAGGAALSTCTGYGTIPTF